MSNAQIVNLTKTFKGRDLEQLQICTWYGRLPGRQKSGTVKTVFDSIVFLIRDYEDEPWGRRDEEFNKIGAETKSESVKQSYSGIRRAFDSISTYTLPVPGKNVRRNSEKDKKVTIGDCEEEFIDASKELFYFLFLCLPEKNQLRTGAEIIQRFKGLESRLEGIKNPKQALEDSMLNKAFVEAGQYYDAEYEKAYGIEFADNEAIESYLHKILDEAITLFENDESTKLHPDAQLKMSYKTTLSKRGYAEFVEQKVTYILKAQELIRMMEECETQRKLIRKKRLEKRKLVKKITKLEEKERLRAQEHGDTVNPKSVPEELKNAFESSESSDEESFQRTGSVRTLVARYEKTTRAVEEQKLALDRTGKKIAETSLKIGPLGEMEKWSGPARRVPGLQSFPRPKKSACKMM